MARALRAKADRGALEALSGALAGALRHLAERPAVEAALAHKADAAEVSALMARTSASVGALLGDLDAFKGAMQGQFDELRARLSLDRPTERSDRGGVERAGEREWQGALQRAIATLQRQLASKVEHDVRSSMPFLRAAPLPLFLYLFMCFTGALKVAQRDDCGCFEVRGTVYRGAHGRCGGGG